MYDNKECEYGQVAEPPRQPPPHHLQVTSGSGAIVVITIFLFSVVVIYVTSRNSQSAWSGIWGAVIFFSTAMPVGLMAANGSFAQMFHSWLGFLAMREAYRHPKAPNVSVVDSPQIGHREPVQPALPQTSTFVSPHADKDDSAKREAAAWVLQLYGPDGEPDPKKVLMKSDKERPGRVRIAAPSRPAKQWLMDHSILLDLGGTGFRLNLVRCPTITAAQTHLDMANEVGRSRTYHHDTTPTLVNGGVA